MKISKIRFYKEDLDLTRPYTIAYKTISTVDNLFLEIGLQNGVVGLGVSNPSIGVVGEDVTSTFKKLNSEGLDWLIGRDISHFRALTEEVTLRYGKHKGVCAALDIALYDAFCKYLGISLAEFLGVYHQSLPTSITVGIKNVQETLEEAREYVQRGFQYLKIKLGHSVEEDIERLVKLREKFGSAIFIRVDANQGYSVDELTKFYQETQGLSIELIEQPLPAQQIVESKSLLPEIKKLIAADESLIDSESAFKLIGNENACGIFNIKLMKCGGITNALEIATIAHYNSIDLMWGCNDESIISITAALHTALAFSHTKYIDLDGSFDLAKDMVTGGFKIDKGIMYPIRNALGLGVEKL